MTKNARISAQFAFPQAIFGYFYVFKSKIVQKVKLNYFSLKLIISKILHTSWNVFAKMGRNI